MPFWRDSIVTLFFMTIKNIKSEGIKLPILSIDELIKMKRQSARVQDLEDVKALEKIK